MPSKASHRRHVVVLKAPRSASKYAIYANSIVTKMDGNAWFPSPSPSLAEVKAAIRVLEQAAAAALSGGLGKTTARNDALEVLRRLLEGLAGYVQGVADAHLEDSLAIIESAGMSGKRGSGSRAHVFKAKPLANSGSARLTAPVAGDRARYFWQKSTDGGETYLDLPSTTKSSTVVHDLVRGTTVLFRYKAQTAKGETEWSQAIPYFVV